MLHSASFTVLLLPMVVTVSACTHVQPATAPIFEASSESCLSQEPIRTYRRTENLSDKIWFYFESARLPKTKTGKTEIRRFYDFSCAISDSGGNKVVCSYQITPNGKGKEVREPQDVMSALRELLFEYPIANGDSGAMTRYLSCEKSEGVPASCEIAVQIDYIGP